MDSTTTARRAFSGWPHSLVLVLANQLISVKNLRMSIYKRHRFPLQIISYAAWLYHRFSLQGGNGWMNCNGVAAGWPGQGDLPMSGSGA